jgi:hypothetical protein
VDVVALDPGRLEWLRNAFDLTSDSEGGGETLRHNARDCAEVIKP